MEGARGTEQIEADSLPEFLTEFAQRRPLLASLASGQLLCCLCFLGAKTLLPKVLPAETSRSSLGDGGTAHYKVKGRVTIGGDN